MRLEPKVYVLTSPEEDSDSCCEVIEPSIEKYSFLIDSKLLKGRTEPGLSLIPGCRRCSRAWPVEEKAVDVRVFCCFYDQD